MSKGIVVIKEDAKEGALGAGLTRFSTTWPSGKTFKKFVDQGDAVNERVRQQRFAEERGYEVEWDEEGVIFGD